MATGRFEVVLTGELDGARDAGEIRASLQKLFKLGAPEVERLLASAPVAVKRGLDYETAARYKAAIEQAGVRCDLREQKPAEDWSLAPIAAEATAAAAPTAAATDSRPGAPLPPAAGGAQRGPRRLSPGSGLAWLSKAWTMFTAAPGTWVLLWLTFFAVMFLSALVPLVNMLAGFLLPPLLTGGAMFAAHAQHEGGGARVGQLFEGFSRRPGPLLAVGGIFLGLSIGLGLLAGILALVFGVGGAMLNAPHMQGAENLEPAMLLMASGGSLVFMLLFLVVLALIYAVIWFAPALVILDGYGAVEACKQSLRGCLANWLPFIVYGLLLIVLSFVAIIPLGLGLLLLGPVVLLSIYLAYREIFRGEGQAADAGG